MEPWIGFVAWVVVAIATTLVFKLSMTNLFSSLTIGVVAGAFCLAALGQYNVSGCQYELTIWDTIRTIILFASFILWVIWTAYQVFKDNKHRRCCYICRRRQDLLPPTKFDTIDYTRPDAVPSQDTDTDFLAPEVKIE